MENPLNSLKNTIKVIEQKAIFANQFNLPKNKKEYRTFKKIMNKIEKHEHYLSSVPLK